MENRLGSNLRIMNVLPVELWMHVFQEMGSQDWLKQMTTCRLFHSLLQVKLYENVRLTTDLDEENDSIDEAPQPTLFVQTLTARPELFSLVRGLQLYPSDDEALFDDHETPEDNYWDHPVLWQLPYFPHLRRLSLAGIHIDVDCYTAIRSIPRLEFLKAEGCDIDVALLDLQPSRGNIISTLFISHPKSGRGWAALMTPGLRTFIVENTYEDVHMDQVLPGLLPCDLRRTLTKLAWTIEDKFHKELCQFIEPCVHIESLSIKFRYCPCDDAAKRSSHFDELTSRALPMLSEFGGAAEHAATIVTGRSVHSVSLQLWNNTRKDVLLALQLSKVPVTKLVLSEGDEDYYPSDISIGTGLYLDHVPGTVEILSLEGKFDLAQEDQSWTSTLSKLSNLHTIKWIVDSKNFAHDTELVQWISEACPSIRKIILIRRSPLKGSKWMWRHDGTWEHYPITEAIIL